MNRQTIPINEIIVENRQRQDPGDIEELAESLRHYGLIQPIIINQNRQLIAGGRRYTAARLLKWETIDVCFRETLSQDELHELELEENLRRKEETWQERCCHIKTIHDLKQKRAALEGSSWTQRATAEMLGIKGVSNVNYALRIADLIKSGDKEITDSDNLSDAWKKLMGREERAMLAELARRSGASLSNFNSIMPASSLAGFGIEKHIDMPHESECLISNPSAKDATDESTLPENILRLRQIAKGNGYSSLSKEEALQLYLANPLNPIEDFEKYYEERLAWFSKKEQDKITISLSKMLYCCDSIDLMNHPDCKERFDAIITDIPYGIDMSMLNQGNGGDGKGFANIDSVLAEHTVEGNEDLFKRFFPAAYHCLKPNTFLITWVDMWQWRAMADLAIEAGFKVQRWPITWLKSHTCMNQSANTNFTKTTEVALVCRKGTPTLCRTNIPAHITASHDDMKDSLDHPFVKPFAVWSHLIQAVTLEGQHILEPFVGHGSGLLSMLKMKRTVTACEINIEHFNSLIENTKQFYLQQNPNIQFA